jgi:hypothetical protein
MRVKKKLGEHFLVITVIIRPIYRTLNIRLYKTVLAVVLRGFGT